MKIAIDRQEELTVREALNHRTDPEALRMIRYLQMPDLSRTEGSVLKEIVDRVSAIDAFREFDIIEIPEIVPADISFDLFDFAKDHPARSKSDTYWPNDTHILRTHDTVFWYYYLHNEEVKKKIANKEAVGALCYGKVYRKDEIDSRHMNVFHQFGGWYLAPDEQNVVPEDLHNVLGDIVRAVFGESQKFRINTDTFPYTDPSFEVELDVTGTAAEGPAKGQWLEILGSGMPKKSVLSKMGVEGYHGWAFGFGLERLAIASMALPDIRLFWSTDERVKKQMVLGQVYKEVSKYPPIVRDISFIVDKSTFVVNDYFDLVRDIAQDMVEEVALIDTYENAEKFGEGKISYAYRITYRSIDKTLTSEEVDALHKEVEKQTKDLYNASVR